MSGATPVVADIEPDDRSARPGRRSSSKITSATRALVPVHLYGQCCDLTAHPRDRPPSRPDGGGGLRSGDRRELARPARGDDRRRGLPLLLSD